MNFHEFGKENKKVILLIHPLAVDWTVFKYIYPQLVKKYHVIIPSIPGMDFEDPESDFTSIEEICLEIEKYLQSKGIDELECIYGCSMGGGIIIRMIANHTISMKHIIVDGGITPYKFPKIICLLICCADFFMMEIGKHCSVKVLGYMFDPSKYTHEDLLYVKSVLSRMSTKTIWNAFWSTDNYSMPKSVIQNKVPIYYWYGENEKKDRKLDLEYVKGQFTNIIFHEYKGMGHAEFLTLQPDEFVKEMEYVMES